MASETRVLVFMSGRGSGAHAERAVASIAGQSHPHVDLLYVDDASDDGSEVLVRAALDAQLPGRSTLVRNDERWGKAHNASTHLRRAAPEYDVVAVVDADDVLIDPMVLAEVAAAYEQGFDVVWTTYSTGSGIGGNGPLSCFTSPREQPWLSSHLFTFRALLLEEVPESCFQDDAGQWLQAACDQALAYPVLDQTRRYLYLPRVAYGYTVDNPASHHNQDPQSVGLNSRSQQAAAALVRAKPPLACTRHATDVPAVLTSALGTAFARLEGAVATVAQQSAETLATVRRAPFVQRALTRLVEREQVPEQWLGEVGGWSLDVELLAHLAELLDRHEAPRVLELGSGAGTKVLAQLCASRGGRLTTLEHDAGWFARTTAELAQHGLGEVAGLRHCPLVDVEFYGIAGRFYDVSFSVGDVFDVVVVDGPPTATSRLARLPALPCVAPHLNPAGFHVLLDDYEREAEQTVVRMWQRVAPDLTYQTLTFTKQVCVITP